MLKNKYIQYKTFLKNSKIINEKILVGKTKDSILIGPLINKEFDKISFIKRYHHFFMEN
jgi:hypothetical protein